MTADAKRLHPEPLLPGTSNAEVARLTAMYEAELARVGQVPPPAPPAPPAPPVPPMLAQDDADRFARLRTAAARVGVDIYMSDDGEGAWEFVCCKWAKVVMHRSLDDAATWLQRFAGVKVE